MAPNLAPQSPSVYQDILLERLHTLHRDPLETSWVMTASGPLQRPTYTALFYRECFDTAITTPPIVHAIVDAVEMGRGSGPTRDTAKESAAARALVKLPRLPKDKDAHPHEREEQQERQQGASIEENDTNQSTLSQRKLSRLRTSDQVGERHTRGTIKRRAATWVHRAQPGSISSNNHAPT